MFYSVRVQVPSLAPNEEQQIDTMYLSAVPFFMLESIRNIDFRQPTLCIFRITVPVYSRKCFLVMVCYCI